MLIVTIVPTAYHVLLHNLLHIFGRYTSHLGSALCRFVTKLLEDLVFFVVDIPNSGQDVLEIMVNRPDRERQKLMREQNILKQVGHKPKG